MTRASRPIIALLSLAALQVAPVAGTLAAQDSSSTRVIAPFDTQHVHKTLFTWRDAALAGGFTALTIAMFPVDRHIAGQLQNPNTQANRFFDDAATGVELITTPGAYVIGGGMYAIGRWGGHPTLQDVGWHGTEAVLLSSAVTGFLKAVLGRARPYVVADTNPHDFKFGGGFTSTERQSFPSGHTTTAFAAAAAVTSDATTASGRRVVRGAGALRRGDDGGALAHVPQQALGERRGARRGDRHVQRAQGRALFAHPSRQQARPVHAAHVTGHDA
jgi:membrane-associated phospholipid phosphatase